MSNFKSSDRIRRAKHEKNYTVILNSTIQDSRLSWKARGLHHYILSLPDDWSICIAHLTEQSLPDGEASVKSALKELEAQGYLSKVRLKDDRGRFSKVVWDIYETPQVDFQLMEKSPKRKASKQSPQVDFPQVDKPQVDKPQVDKPQVENRGLISTDIPSNKDQPSTYLQKQAHENFENQFNPDFNRFAPRGLAQQGFLEWHLGGKRNNWHDDLLAIAKEHLSAHEKPSSRNDCINFINNICFREDWAKLELLTDEARSRQQKAKAATQNENNAKPRLLKPNPLTWTEEQKTWSYDQWEKYLNEQNTSNASIYANY